MSSTSTATDLEMKISLEVEPHRNFRAWLDELATLASAQCAEYSQRGALHLACTDELWASLPEHSNAVPPRPTYPRPDPLDPNANPTARLIYEDAKAAHIAHATASAKLRRAAISSIGRSNQLLIEDPLHGMLVHSAQSIIDALIPLYGTYTEDAISQLETQLTAKLVSVDSFDQHVGAYRTNLAQLARAGQALLPFKAFTTFLDTLSPFPHFRPHITSFITAHPALHQRTFPALTDHLRLHLPTIRSASAGNAFAGRVVSPPPQDHKALLAKVSSLERKLAALSASPAPSPPPPPPSRARQGPTTSLTTPEGFFYCFIHGHNLTHGWIKPSRTWQWHGTRCQAIARDPSRYTPQQEAAKSPTEVAGGNQRVQRKVIPSPSPASSLSPTPSPPTILTPPNPPSPARKNNYANPFACFDASPPSSTPRSFPRDDQSRPLTSPLPYTPPSHHPTFSKPSPPTTTTGVALFDESGHPVESWRHSSFASLNALHPLDPSPHACSPPCLLQPRTHDDLAGTTRSSGAGHAKPYRSDVRGRTLTNSAPPPLPRPPPGLPTPPRTFYKGHIRFPCYGHHQVPTPSHSFSGSRRTRM